MKSKLLMVVTIIGFISAAALAKEPLVQAKPAPPIDRGLGYTLGVQYENTDIEVDLEGDEQDFDIEALYGTFTVPLSPRWDFELRLGGAKASTEDFDGRTDWAWGMGLHVVLASWDELTLEAKGQLESMTSSASRTIGIPDENDVLYYYRGDDELSLFEYSLMAGPTWSQGPLSLSAGAMVRYLTGDFSIFGSSSQDVDHHFRVGGYAGARFDVTDAIGIFGNVQLDEQLTRFSAGALWRL
jgi:hypothetical protein